MERLNKSNKQGYDYIEFHNAVNKYIKSNLNLIPGFTPVAHTCSPESEHGFSISLVYPYINKDEIKQKNIYVPLNVDHENVYGFGRFIITSEPKDVVSQDDIDMFYDILKEYLGKDMIEKIVELELENIDKTLLGTINMVEIEICKRRQIIISLNNGHVSVNMQYSDLQSIKSKAEFVAEINHILETSRLNY